MKLFTTDRFTLPLPEGHRFPIDKYRLLREQLANSGNFDAGDFCVPESASVDELLRAHSAGYVEHVLSGTLDSAEQRAIGFPWSQAMVERALRSAGATLGASRAALEDGLAASLSGGTHHAHYDRGAGFCIFNDAAIAARALQAESRARRILIVDCDVHQGDGTATILDGDDSAFTFSIHSAKNYPFRKARSDLDIELPDRCADDAYLDQLDTGLSIAFDAARPDFVIYLAGADPYADDRLGRLALSMKGLLERDRRVIERCVTAGIPLAITMAGGYARNIVDTVSIHASTIGAANAAFRSGKTSRTA